MCYRERCLKTSRNNLKFNILNFKNSKKMQEYYKYLNTGIVYNVHGNDCLLQADSDKKLSPYTVTYIE